ncbi:MAG: FtsX-like permease family protein [Bacteroidota bacterium]
MNLSHKIARRYTFAKRGSNAINFITGIAIFGLTIGTAALILVLSVFNGLGDLISSMYSQLNPDILITPKQGKTFVLSEEDMNRIRSMNAIAAVSQTLEERAYFDSGEKQKDGIIKGVDDQYTEVINLRTGIYEGFYQLQYEDQHFAVLGVGMADELGINVENPLEILNVFALKKDDASIFGQFYTRRPLRPAGTLYFETDFNNNYILSSLDFVQSLLKERGRISALEIKLNPGFSSDYVGEELQSILGDGFDIRDKFAQNSAFYKLMQMEKWLAFAIVSLMLMLVSFNMIGALWMIVLEKRKDIAILKSMGAPDNMIRNIFLRLGMRLSVFGIVIGFAIALLVYWVQKTYGIIGIPGTFTISDYPISLHWFDFVAVTATVLGVGFLASLMPARRAKNEPALIREE